MEEAVAGLNTKLLGSIPLEISLRTGSDEGVPYMSNESFEGRTVWNAFMETATAVTSFFGGTTPTTKPGMMSRLFGLNK